MNDSADNKKKNTGTEPPRHANLWTATGLGASDMDAYAERQMVHETRTGLLVLSVLMVALLLLALGLYRTLGFSGAYVYNSLLLAALAVHIGLCARRVAELRALHLLGMTLLTISAAGLISTAHQTGELSPATLASVVLLFLVVPLVPWGLREAATVVAIIYGLMTVSVWSVASRFDAAMLWTLEFYMLGASVVSLTLVALGVQARKGHLVSRYGLEKAHRELVRLSSIDPLTGAGNRRMLDEAPARLRERFPGEGESLHFAVLDLDGFKSVNDNHGHETGDRVLVALANACARAVGTAGCVMRLGGDEFAMLYVGDEPQSIIDDAVGNFRAEVVSGADGRPLPLSVSVGRASRALHDGAPLDDLYRRADDALYTAKTSRAATRDTTPAVSSPPQLTQVVT